MNNLTELLDKASEAYYNGNPIMSDATFDKLAELIGYTKVGTSNKQHDNVEKHLYRMYSLQKYYEGEGENPLQGIKNIDASPKIDGAAISLLYVDGTLVRVLTRGDGVEGTVITDKFLATKLVPHTIELNGIIQVTGEIAAPKHVENARNYAAGSLSLKNIDEFKTRAIQFFAYNVEPHITDSFSEDMQVLHNVGFSTIKDSEIHRIYPCDGIVFRMDDNALFDSIGYTAKHPRGAFALKERGASVETTILDVVWQVGKTGKVTPVAILDPIMIGDAIVSRATLNNIAFIRSLDLHIGDCVGVIRSGEIIPQITHKVE